MNDYLIPTSVKEVQALGWDYIDVILFSGDAFIDHPSFGTAVIARWLQKHGYRGYQEDHFEAANREFWRNWLLSK